MVSLPDHHPPDSGFGQDGSCGAQASPLQATNSRLPFTVHRTTVYRPAAPAGYSSDRRDDQVATGRGASIPGGMYSSPWDRSLKPPGRDRRSRGEPPARDAAGGGLPRSLDGCGACLAVSLALHAAGRWPWFPVPGSGERGAAASAVAGEPVPRISGTAAPGSGGATRTRYRGASRRTSARSRGRRPRRPALPAGSRDAPASAPDPDLPGGGRLPDGESPRRDPGSAAVAGIRLPDAPLRARGRVRRDRLSDPASDQAAALLLARVEAALVYPEAARRRGTEGVVGLRILLDGSGALLRT
ncbi:MAG: energy transducer TonB [Desulfobacterales bacterium]|nr:energy transducer TonB [Desulfobacterales bacterium]